MRQKIISFSHSCQRLQKGEVKRTEKKKRKCPWIFCKLVISRCYDVAVILTVAQKLYIKNICNKKKQMEYKKNDRISSFWMIRKNK